MGKISERISLLRKAMAREKINVYIIPTADYHDSEYAAPYFRAREYFSGFTGSAGTLVVTEKNAALFTDGRYFIQAEKELEGSGIELMKMGCDGVPKLTEYVKSQLPENGAAGFDGRVVSTEYGKKLAAAAKEKGGYVIADADFVSEIWTAPERPALQYTDVFCLDEKFTGESVKSKLERVRKVMREKNTGIHILTALDDIAWLFNIRAHDIPSCPVAMAYAVITLDSAVIYGNTGSFGDEVRTVLEKNGVNVKPYDDFYKDIKKTGAGNRVLLSERVNYSAALSLDKSVETVFETNPETLFKAVKNSAEIENIRQAHIKDGIAVTKFMFWLKNAYGKQKFNECEAAEKCCAFRREQEGFIEPSFETICAFGANAAMMHYSASPDSCADIESNGVLLLDSGAHYYQGSTDITRTYILGEVSGEIKKHYTLTVKSMLNLANAKFLYGCRGVNLDILARGPLWEEGIDYRCGTGHGVGYLLNIHESPNGFRWKIVPERKDSAVLEEGMVTTDEPGVYIEGSHGIRIENELLCKKAEVNEYGQFMEFEAITYAPIDLDGIDTKYLNETDIKRLNNYHKMVYQKLSTYFSGGELELLKKYTKSI